MRRFESSRVLTREVQCFAISMDQILVVKKKNVSSVDANVIREGNKVEAIIIRVADMEILEPEQHEGQVCDVKRNVAGDEKTDRISCGLGVVRCHDIGGFHPDEKN